MLTAATALMALAGIKSDAAATGAGERRPPRQFLA